MSTGWDKYEPAPLEFVHERVISLFHDLRKERGVTDTKILMDGWDIANIIWKAKMEAYTKYPTSVLTRDAVPKELFK